MIRYALKCDQNHMFESWFQNAAAYDGLRAAGHVTCPECGSAKVEKSLMAPKVRPARSVATAPVAANPATPTTLAAPSSEIEAEIARLRARVEAESEYVGGSFAREARAMHLGDAPERSIYGEAKLADARELLEDGVPVMPLPFTPTRKSN
ncbi:hypothetical protein SAMN05444851_2410 [Aliiroseovarius sediminilitoris]|uniref:DUF1178 family protein n=1 Tax=Aliiroseovarius sediminilitoris TaxID=1173584 RepID=A0A1I0QBL5_9RHOB|nr:DUF1178 family protein [Aliiroseovarius sediminilitoris]SEW24431.1 hypothetical protein SAMN05444851_2410 [Aliiroseovarius sediminilitoris]